MELLLGVLYQTVVYLSFNWVKYAGNHSDSKYFCDINVKVCLLLFWCLVGPVVIHVLVLQSEKVHQSKHHTILNTKGKATHVDDSTLSSWPCDYTLLNLFFSLNELFAWIWLLHSLCFYCGNFFSGGPSFFSNLKSHFLLITVSINNLV